MVMYRGVQRVVCRALRASCSGLVGANPDHKKTRPALSLEHTGQSPTKTACLRAFVLDA